MQQVCKSLRMASSSRPEAAREMGNLGKGPARAPCLQYWLSTTFSWCGRKRYNLNLNLSLSVEACSPFVTNTLKCLDNMLRQCFGRQIYIHM